MEGVYVKSQDHHLGELIKKRRDHINLPQKEMAEILGITYQQLQKYECGQNRVPATKLLPIANAMNVPVQYFYDELETLKSLQKEEITSHINFKRSLPLSMMIIEDNAADELVIREAIEASEVDARIRIYHTADAALLQLKADSQSGKRSLPDIILLDLNLPKMSGLDALTLFKKDREIAKVPVIIISNTIDTDELIKSYGLHASGFIGKSMDHQLFNLHIANMMHYWANTVILPSMQYDVA